MTPPPIQVALRRAWLTPFVLAALTLAAEAQTAAPEICVECSGPAFTYKCAVMGAERVGQSRNGERALEYVCISELAKAGGHSNCRVSRDFAGPCIGHPRTVDITKPADQPAVTTADGKAAEKPPASPGTEAPATLEQLARETVEKSKQQFDENDRKMKDAAKDAGTQLEKAGKAVGEAVKKTVGCLVTLFTKC